MAIHFSSRSGGAPDDYTVREFIATEFGVDEDELLDTLVNFLAVNADLREPLVERFRAKEQAKAAEWHTARRETPEELEELEEEFRRGFENDELWGEDEGS